MTEMITIARAEYDRLRAIADEVSDVAAFDNAVARLARGEDEIVPQAFADRLLDGESPLRVYRDPYDYSAPGASADFLPQNAHPVHH